MKEIPKTSHLIFLVAIIILLLHSVAFAGKSIKIKDIRYSLSNEKVRVVIEFNSLPHYSSHILENPDRLYFDIEDTVIPQAKAIKTNDRRVKGIRVGQFNKKVARVVIDLASSITKCNTWEERLRVGILSGYGEEI